MVARNFAIYGYDVHSITYSKIEGFQPDIRSMMPKFTCYKISENVYPLEFFLLRFQFRHSVSRLLAGHLETPLGQGSSVSRYSADNTSFEKE